MLDFELHYFINNVFETEEEKDLLTKDVDDFFSINKDNEDIKKEFSK